MTIKKTEIEYCNKMVELIDSFDNCYDEKLWGERDGPVPTDKLITFLVQNEDLTDIAETIRNVLKAQGRL